MAKSGEWKEAIRLALADKDPQALRKLANNLVCLAERNDLIGMQALKEIGDRLDGKPIQALDIDLTQRTINVNIGLQEYGRDKSQLTSETIDSVH